MVQVMKHNANKIAKKYLKNHGITQAYVARRMGIRQANFSDRINGRLKFNADFALRFAKVLGISPTIFLDESSSKWEESNQHASNK